MTKISCLCVTRNRVKSLKRAIDCFLKQTYANKELVVVYESDDQASVTFLNEIDHDFFKKVEVEAVPKQPLGALRNIAIEQSTGDYFAQWDDDDFYDKERLELQYQQLINAGKEACVLRRWRMYDRLQDKLYISNYMDVVGGGENTILCSKNLLEKYGIRYPELKQGEDTAVIQWLILHDKVVALDRPDLYIYEVNGQNTWHREHFEEIFTHSCYEASEEELQLVRKQLSIQKHS